MVHSFFCLVRSQSTSSKSQQPEVKGTTSKTLNQRPKYTVAASLVKEILESFEGPPDIVTCPCFHAFLSYILNDDTISYVVQRSSLTQHGEV